MIISFRAEFDGTDQKYVVMTPRSFEADEPVSVRIALHGHGSDRWQFVRQSREECRATRDVAAVNGMLLVSPDYRATASWMGPAAEADVIQVVDILRHQFHVRHIVICGGSMDGTSALLFTALHPESVDGVVALNGTANLVEFDGFQDAIAASFGGAKQDVPNEDRKRSAEFFARNFTMPHSAATGGKGAIVPAVSVLRLLE